MQRIFSVVYKSRFLYSPTVIQFASPILTKILSEDFGFKGPLKGLISKIILSILATDLEYIMTGMCDYSLFLEFYYPSFL